MKMALLSQSSPSSSYATSNKPHFLLPSHHHSLLPIPKSILLPPIKSQKSSSEPPISTQSTDDTSTGRNKSWSWKNTGRIGFGRAPIDTADSSSKQREAIFQGGLVFGRAPVETPNFFSKKGEAIFVEEQSEEPPISTQSTDDTSSSSTGRNKSWSWKKTGRIGFGRAPVDTADSFSKQREAIFQGWLGFGIAPVETPDSFSKQGEAIFEEEQSEEQPISAQLTDDTSSSSTGRNKSWSWKKKGRIGFGRAPVETPDFFSKQGETKLEEEQSGSEKAFVSAWLGLGSIIIIQGLLLAASGFFPEKWNKLFVKYLYPAFTPTVFLFVAGAVVYGLLKYQQNEKPRKPK